MEKVPIRDLVDQLHALGVAPGGILLVHTAFSRVGPVEKGILGLIEALRVAVGPRGTLVMPSMSDDDEHPFDPERTPCRSLGVVPDMFWRLPGVCRSNSPHAFAAAGPDADHITAPHPVEVPHGPKSPVGRVHDAEGQVLLLGASHDANTTIHLAEALAGVRYRRPKHCTVLRDAKLMRVDYAETDHCCQRFVLMDQWLDAARRQRRGRVGRAEARLAGARVIANLAIARLRLDETVFLHPAGVDPECDEARASLSGCSRAAMRS